MRKEACGLESRRVGRNDMILPCVLHPMLTVEMGKRARFRMHSRQWGHITFTNLPL